MTVDTEVSSIRYTGIADGVALAAPFPVQATTEIAVFYGADLQAVEGVDYTVALDPPDYLTAAVTTLAGFAALTGGIASINRIVPYLQAEDIPIHSRIGSSRLEQMVDRVTFMTQQLRDKLVRTIGIPFADPTSALGNVPAAADRAGKFFAWDADGKPVAAVGTTSGGVFTAFGTAWVAFGNGATAMTSALGLGFSAFVAGLRAKANDLEFLQGLGFSEFWYTVRTTASYAEFRTAFGLYSTTEIDLRTRGAISGWTSKPNAGTPASQIDITAGSGEDSTAASAAAGAGQTKKIDTLWAAGTGNGSLDTGVIANADYDIYAIWRADFLVDYLTVVSGNAPIMPATYVYKRKVGWFKRAAGSVVAYDTYETAGGGLEHAWRVPTLDINLANTLTTARRTDAVKVPLTFSTEAILNVTLTDGAVVVAAWLCCPDQADAAPSRTAAPLANVVTEGGSAGSTSTSLRVRTSAAGLIAARADVATVDLYAVSTMGFVWPRR